MSDWLDSRRLIGPNILWRHPGALLEVAGAGPDFERRLGAWRVHVRALMDALGWQDHPIGERRHAGGALLIIGAPVDVLYTATEVNEGAWTLANGGADFDAVLADLRRASDAEADPAARVLHEAARRRGKTALVDEHGVSVGMGRHGRHWPPGKAPAPDAVDWDALDDVPAVLVTGTNGKTTTVRLLAAMALDAGLTPGLTCTESIQVGREVLDRGDYSGPGGARRVLRDPRVDLALLETARGGLLRRGLALERAAAAVITNIAADHLGDGGIGTVDELAEVKFMVTRVLGKAGTAVLNADDPRCRVHGERLKGPVAWFSLDASPHRRDGSRWYWLMDGSLMRQAGAQLDAIAAVADCPFLLGGAARHNIANALAAIAAADAVGLPLDAVRSALGRFGTDPADNPGRSEVLDLDGVRVLIDFAHNPDGMQAMFHAAGRSAAARFGVMFGQAGDRSDAAIADLARTAARSGAEYFVVKEMAEYRRGREPGEVAGIIQQVLRDSGVDEARIAYVEDEADAAAAALRWARPGDLLLLFVHGDREAVMARLRR